MIDGLIAGRLYGAPKEGEGKSGNVYTTAKVKVTGGNGDTFLCNVIAFDDDVQDALMALDDGDSVALSGSLTPKVYHEKNGDARPALDLVCHKVLTAYVPKGTSHQ
jgi:single-stranded DNA-binding protein